MLFTADINTVADSAAANPVFCSLPSTTGGAAPQVVTELLADVHHVDDRLVVRPRAVERTDEVVLVGVSRTRQRHRPAHRARQQYPHVRA
jgi:hypothetical protein